MLWHRHPFIDTGMHSEQSVIIYIRSVNPRATLHSIYMASAHYLLLMLLARDLITHVRDAQDQVKLSIDEVQPDRPFKHP